MKKEEIYFLKTVGIVIQDEKEAITTDSIDKFPNIYTFIEELNRLTEGKDWSTVYPLLKCSIYTSCMMHYTIEVYRKGLISHEIYDNAMHKAETMLRSIGSNKIIALTLLYEGPYYLHPEIYPVYRRAGYSKIVKCYIDVFKPLIKKIEKEKDFTTIYGNEKQAYMDLYKNFIKLESCKDER